MLKIAPSLKGQKPAYQVGVCDGGNEQERKEEKDTSFLAAFLKVVAI